MIAIFMISCHAHNEEGHAHNEEGEHIGESEERPTIDKTIWTDKTELFVEFPALIVGNGSRFAAHFTILDGHKGTIRKITGLALRWR